MQNEPPLVFITIMGIGQPNVGYGRANWKLNEKMLGKVHIPSLLLAKYLNADKIIILGTEQSFDTTKPHYSQYKSDLSELHFDAQKVEEKTIGRIDTPGEFWEAFNEIASIKDLKKNADLVIDITNGFRIQPFLLLMSGHFLSEMRENIQLKKIYYGRYDKGAAAGDYIDFTEITELLQWIKASQFFVETGSAKALNQRLLSRLPDELKEHAEQLKRITVSYSFNMVNEIRELTRKFLSRKNQKDFKNYVTEQLPAFSQVWPYLENFFRQIDRNEPLELQFMLAKRNFTEANYARSIIILREAYITLLMKSLGKLPNKYRIKVTDNVINKINIAYYAQSFPLTLNDREQAKGIYEKIQQLIPVKILDRYYTNWEKVRSLRNNAGHGKKYDLEKNDGKNPIQALKKLLEDSETLLDEFNHLDSISHEDRKEIERLISKKSKKSKKLYVITNEGIHPISEKIHKQFGADINTEVITRGNTGLDIERQVAVKALALTKKYSGYKFYIIPGGYPYLALTIYNTIHQATASHPVWLQYDQKKDQYIEKYLDPRKLTQPEFVKDGKAEK